MQVFTNLRNSNFKTKNLLILSNLIFLQFKFILFQLRFKFAYNNSFQLNINNFVINSNTIVYKLWHDFIYNYIEID